MNEREFRISNLKGWAEPSKEREETSNFAHTIISAVRTNNHPRNPIHAAVAMDAKHNRANGNILRSMAWNMTNCTGNF